ncbi:hypothetical protein WG947_04535 [Pontibacter sp. H259]|uniref:hypothetical protein n=1 Tax=Pontibacter sp. H259 TaxID=3133421 RepID=UPI0030BADB74
MKANDFFEQEDFKRSHYILVHRRSNGPTLRQVFTIKLPQMQAAHKSGVKYSFEHYLTFEAYQPALPAHDIAKKRKALLEFLMQQYSYLKPKAAYLLLEALAELGIIRKNYNSNTAALYRALVTTLHLQGTRQALSSILNQRQTATPADKPLIAACKQRIDDFLRNI